MIYLTWIVFAIRLIRDINKIMGWKWRSSGRDIISESLCPSREDSQGSEKVLRANPAINQQTSFYSLFTWKLHKEFSAEQNPTEQWAYGDDHLVERCGTHLSQGQCLERGTAANTEKLGDGTTRKERFGQCTISIHSLWLKLSHDSNCTGLGGGI